MENINALLGGLTPILLIASGLFLSARLGFFWLCHPIKTIRSILKKPKAGGVSPFRAVTLALSGTLGVGNIAGVAGAIALGGFGAIFWMWVSALCAMALKYSEIVLAVSHRRWERGAPYGGASYYIRDFFSSKNLPRLGTAVAAFFAAVCAVEVLSTGCGIQISASAEALESGFGLPRVAVGIFAALLTLYAAGGGVDTVSRLTVVAIPILSVGYILISALLLIIKGSAIPAAFAAIFSDAFDTDSLFGGALGFFSCRAVRFGAMRGLLSNEAGCGTAPFAHAGANTDDPAEQGIWGLFEVFFDTIVLCTVTALVIIASYGEVAQYAGEPIKMAIKAYACVLGRPAEIFLSVAVAAFGIATVVCCAHYGRECVRFLLNGRRGALFFGIWIALYSAFAAVGATLELRGLWAVSDLTLGLMTLINLPVLCALGGETVRLSRKNLVKNSSSKNP